MAILTNAGQFGKFNILDYLQNLEIVKETHSDIEVYCPVCQAKNFKIDKKKGKYYGYSCDCMEDRQTRKEIVKSVLPARPWQNPHYSPILAGKSNQSSYPLPEIPEKVTFAQLETIPGDRPQRIAYGKAKKITYPYSATQGVDRIETPNSEKAKGYDKTFRQWHLDTAGKRINKKGEMPWPLYRETEVIAAQDWPILVEGEECVESLREIGLAATTFQGSNWSQVIMVEAFTRLKNVGVPGLIVIPDNDDTGEKKAITALKASLEAQFPVIIVDITALWPEAPEKGDIADWITWGQTNNMYNPDFIRRIEEEIHQAVNERQRLAQEAQEHQPLTLPTLTKAEQVKLRIKLWLEESDITTKILEKSEICSQYQIDKRSFETIAAALDENSQTPQSQKYKVSEFTELPTGGSAIIMPGVPSVGVTILGGSPGSGKTTLMMDMAASIILGDEILGDNPARQGSILFVSSDEPHTETQQKLINRGIADLEDGHMEIILNWDISQWAFLEDSVEEMRPACILIDSFNAIHRDPNFDENSAQASYTIKKLERLSAKYCIPIILSHHLCKSQDNKGTNKLRGSTAIAASCSSIMVLDSTSDGTKKLTQPKIRGSEPLNLTLEMNVETGRFSVLGEGQVDETTKTLGQKLTAFFNHHQGTLFEMSEICAQFPGENSKVLNNALNRLVKRGEIIKRPSKMNRRFKVYGIQGIDSAPSTPTTPPPPTTSVLIDDLNHESLIEKGLEQIITQLSPEPVINDHPDIPTLPSDLNAELINHHFDSQEKALNSETLTEIEDNQIITPAFPEGGGEQTPEEAQTPIIEYSEVECPEIIASPEIEPQTTNGNDLISETGIYVTRLGWNTEELTEYLETHYSKSDWTELTIMEFLDFNDGLKSLVQQKTVP
jgi:hypothetical protein